MKKNQANWIFLCIILCLIPLNAQEGLVPAFKQEPNDIVLHRHAIPGIPFNKVGRKFAIFGDESGSFEAWAYPLKLLRNFKFSFFERSSTMPIHGKDIVRYISVTPEATTLTYTYQSFTVKATYITPVEEPGTIILLEVDAIEPLTIACGFLPVLQPMWPAGLGGQYAYWDKKIKAYILSEPTGKNHGIVGSPCASGMSYTPAHMLSDVPNEFKIELSDPQNIKGKYVPIYIAGSKGTKENVLKVYERLKNTPEKFYRKNVIHYRNLREDTLYVHTPNRKLNLAFEWAKIAFDNLIVDNPDLGKGLIAGLGPSGTSSRPGFGWFFGGDAYINTFSLLSYGAFQTARDTLAFTQKWQRKDGKMAHELSQAAAYIDWWNDYHYGYIHGDTTPYYIAVMYDYVKTTGDVEFIKRSWDSLKRAFAWCLSTDENGDGLMDNKKAGLGALEYGALTGIKTDIYLAAIWARAAYGMQYMAEIAGDKSYCAKAAKFSSIAQRAFNEKFWDKENQFYMYAFNDEGNLVKEISPWNSVGLMWNFGAPERSLHSLKRLSSSELMTDWGIRSISNKSQFFQPLNYNYGAVWPFLTSWVTAAFYTHHLPLQGYSLLMSTAQHTFDHSLGCITEVFSGTHNVWPQEAVAHQGFSSAGVVLPFVRGLIGLEGEAVDRSISFSPHFPASWERILIDRFEIGKAVFSFDYKRNTDRITVCIQAKNAHGYTIHFAPAISQGSRIQSLTVNGETHPFKIRDAGQVTQILSDIPGDKVPLFIELSFIPTLEILPVVPETKTGDKNKGLKIISAQREGFRLEVSVEGISGGTYELDVLHADLIESVKGAKLEDGKLKFQVPEGIVGEFTSHSIMIQIKAHRNYECLN